MAGWLTPGTWQQQQYGQLDPYAAQREQNAQLDSQVSGELRARAQGSSYNPGQNYSQVVAPFLQPDASSTQFQNTLSGLVSGAAPIRRAQQINVDTSNPYEAKLRALLDNPDAIANTGAYKFALQQGQQGLERSAAAKGMLNSGNTLAELTKYGQGMASQQYGSEADRLGKLTGQQQQYILGQQQNAIGGQNADTSAYGAETGRMKTLGDLTSQGSTDRVAAGRLALDAASQQAGDYWNAQKTAGNWYQMSPRKITQNQLGQLQNAWG